MTNTTSSPAAGGGSLALVAGNSWWSLSAFLIGIAANLVTLPFVIHRLGVYDFGVAGLCVAVSTPFTLVGTTLGQSVAQAVARGRASADWKGIEDFCGTATVIGFGVVVCAGVILFAAIPIIIGALEVRRYGPLPMWLFSATLTAGWMSQQFSLVMQGIHVACQSYRRVAAINATGAVLLPISVLSMVERHRTVEGYLLALTLAYAATTLVWLGSLYRNFRWSIVRPRIAAPAARSIAGFTGWQMMAQLFANLAGQADRYLLGAMVGATAVGYYNTAQRLEEVAYIGVLRTGDALFPHFSSISGTDLRRQADGYLRASWMLNLFAVAVLGPLLPWAGALLNIWVGGGMAAHASRVLIVLTAAGLLGSAGNVFILFSLGVAQTKYTALISAVTALVSSLTSVMAISRFGFAAAGFGALAGMVANSIVMVALSRRHFGRICAVKDIFASTLSPVVVGIVFALAMSRLHLPALTNWGQFLLAYAVTSIVLGALVTATSALTIRGRRSLGDLRDLATIFSRRLLGANG